MEYKYAYVNSIPSRSSHRSNWSFLSLKHKNKLSKGKGRRTNVKEQMSKNKCQRTNVKEKYIHNIIKSEDEQVCQVSPVLKTQKILTAAPIGPRGPISPELPLFPYKNNK